MTRARLFPSILAVVVVLVAAHTVADPDDGWVASWAAAAHQMAPSTTSFPPMPLPATLKHRTVRQIVRASVGGDRLRVLISNEYGAVPLKIGAAAAAIARTGAVAKSRTSRPLTFAGSTSLVIAPGQQVLSDPVEITVPPFGDLAISLYFPDDTVPTTGHLLGLESGFVSPEGDATMQDTMAVDTTVEARLFLTRIDVRPAAQTNLIVAFGDSLTDGLGSTPLANRRWTDDLARRAAAVRRGPSDIAVINEGIASNRLLHGSGAAGISGFARFDRDALAIPGVTHIILLEGINDIAATDLVSPDGKPLIDPSEYVGVDDLIAGYKQMVQRAHARHIKVIGGTITPCGGFRFEGFCTPAKDKSRKKLNEWIRHGGAFDGVVDFAFAVEDRQDPSRLSPDYDSGDHIHPNDAGYRAMADAIDLSLFD